MPPAKSRAKAEEKRPPRTEAQRRAQEQEEAFEPEMVMLRCQHRFGTYPYQNEVTTIVHDQDSGLPVRVPTKEGKQVKADEGMAQVLETEIPAILKAGLIKKDGSGPVWFADDARARQHGMMPIGVTSGQVQSGPTPNMTPPNADWESAEVDEIVAMVELEKVTDIDAAMQWELYSQKRPGVIMALAKALEAADEVEGDLAAEVG